jgi:hypothetical protein
MFSNSLAGGNITMCLMQTRFSQLAQRTLSVKCAKAFLGKNGINIYSE